ncbi:MAG: hypothetical protein FWG88_08380 [Oscillospiraceae bacterium]|nr:hypothetical protein [Oscillospiraceae bacterium]
MIMKNMFLRPGIKTYLSYLCEQMETRYTKYPENTPVLTRIFYEEISQLATPDINKRILEKLSKWLSDEEAAGTKGITEGTNL